MKQIVIIFFAVFLFSCKNNKEVSTTIFTNPKLSTVQNHSAFETVKQEYEKEIKGWNELKILTSFMHRFESVSANEALSNALELRDLVKNLKDSSKPKMFDTPSFKARVNVLHNEALRLADITFIPRIKAEEVNMQVEKTLAGFSYLNSKINAVLDKKYYEKSNSVSFKNNKAGFLKQK